MVKNNKAQPKPDLSPLHEQIIQACEIIIADTKADHCDDLTVSNAERLLSRCQSLSERKAAIFKRKVEKIKTSS